MKITDTKLQELKIAIVKSEEKFQAEKDKLQVALDKSTNDIEQATDNLNKAKLGDDPTAYSEARKALQLAKDSKEFFNHKLSNLEEESLLTADEYKRVRDEALAEATANKEKAEAEVAKMLTKIKEIATNQAEYTEELNSHLKTLQLDVFKDDSAYIYGAKGTKTLTDSKVAKLKNGFDLFHFHNSISGYSYYKEIVK
ncbi:hypothetical protein [Aerococcus urinaeequi]|uniref:hypothetical protein n=1 Tax=Aerococcus urinaeequi TaxID=51665 RepID=UPI003D6B897C